MVMLFGPPKFTQYRHPLFVQTSRIAYPEVSPMVFSAASLADSGALSSAPQEMPVRCSARPEGRKKTAPKAVSVGRSSTQLPFTDKIVGMLP